AQPPIGNFRIRVGYPMRIDFREWRNKDIRRFGWVVANERTVGSIIRRAQQLVYGIASRQMVQAAVGDIECEQMARPSLCGREGDCSASCGPAEVLDTLIELRSQVANLAGLERHDIQVR